MWKYDTFQLLTCEATLSYQHNCRAAYMISRLTEVALPTALLAISGPFNCLHRAVTMVDLALGTHALSLLVAAKKISGLTISHHMQITRLL